ncbi:MAG TPA: succinylglutamate desuccinylase/aspartoacylase family protein [Thermomicrobiales bacterium]|jgi:hypothetical protein|nr:succinylglutamate desuccinylase/aspartoacylase family protein [Thermomicrobiales bacterium]
MTSLSITKAAIHDVVDLLELPEAGTIRRGFLAFSHPALAGMRWPYTIVRGRDDGPRVVVTAGVHPTEYPAIEASIRLTRGLDPATLRGTVIVLPLVNLPSFLTRTPFVSPLDGLNPNRVFPGNADGTVTEVIVDAIFRSVIAGADAYIDLHGGDVYEDLIPFICWAVSGDADLDARAAALARSFGIKHVVVVPQQSSTTGLTSDIAAALAGIPAVLAEGGGRGLLTEPETAMLHEGCLRGLRHLGILPGGEPESVETVEVGYQIIHSPAEGLWYPAVTAGDMITAGQTVGAIRDLFGDHLVDVVTPVDGVVLYVTSSPAMRSGGITVGVGPH